MFFIHIILLQLIDRPECTGLLTLLYSFYSKDRFMASLCTNEWIFLVYPMNVLTMETIQSLCILILMSLTPTVS